MGLTTFYFVVWGGLDTLTVVAGVSALRPLLATAGVERTDSGTANPDAKLSGIQESINIAKAACNGNFIGPLNAAVSFVRI